MIIISPSDKKYALKGTLYKVRNGNTPLYELQSLNLNDNEKKSPLDYTKPTYTAVLSRWESFGSRIPKKTLWKT